MLFKCHHILLYSVYLLLILLHAGCADSVELPEHIAEIDNLTVYSIDENPPYQIQLEKDKVFRDTEGVIGIIGELVVDEGGRVYIADSQQNVIHVFNADGSYETTFGAQGQGPEEYRSLSSLRIHEDQLYVYDYMQQRISIISLDSLTLTRTIQLNADSWDHIKELEESTPGAQLFIRDSHTFLMSFRERPQPDGVAYERHYYLNEQGVISSDLIFKQRGVEFLITSEGGRITNVFFPPFYRSSLMVVSDKGLIYSAWMDDFLIQIYDEEGLHLRSFYYPFSQSSLVRQDILDLFQGHEQQVYRNAKLPDKWPALDRMLLDDEQRLWVSAISDDEEHYTWWVLDEAGKLLASFKWPGERLKRHISSENRFEIIRDGFVYSRELNEETELQEIVRYRIEQWPSD